MPTWYAYKRLATNEIGFCTDDSQGFTQLQNSPAFSLHAIPNKPDMAQFFDVSDNTLKTRPRTQSEQDRDTNRLRLKTIALKGGKNLSQQDRDELMCLRALMDLGEL